jgi:hypothetical protein
MIKVIPDFHVTDSYVLVNPAQVTHAWDVISNVKALKDKICLHLEFSNGKTLTARNLVLKDWEKIVWSNHFGKWMFPLDYICISEKSSEIVVDEKLKPLCSE